VGQDHPLNPGRLRDQGVLVGPGSPGRLALPEAQEDPEVPDPLWRPAIPGALEPPRDREVPVAQDHPVVPGHLRDQGALVPPLAPGGLAARRDLAPLPVQVLPGDRMDQADPFHPLVQPAPAAQDRRRDQGARVLPRHLGGRAAPLRHPDQAVLPARGHPSARSLSFPRVPARRSAIAPAHPGRAGRSAGGTRPPRRVPRPV
jgi:hypothetical protein